LSEYSGSSLAEPNAGDNTEVGLEDEQDWITLNQDGMAQGFLNDIQGLLEGK